MKPNQRKLIESYLEKYLNLQFPDLKIDNKKLFVCPFKSDHNDNDDKPTCKLSNSKLMCLHPVHSSKPMDIFDVVRKSEDGMEKMKDEDIADYLIALLDIQTDDEVEKLFTIYSNSGFKLFPCQSGHKDTPENPKGADANKQPIKGESWISNVTDSVNQWWEWYNAHLNFGLALGEVSGTVALDIDDEETRKKVQDRLGETAEQQTSRGKHYLYLYEDWMKDITHINFRQLKSKNPDLAYDMELRANHAYIIIAPSSVRGEKRVWNGKKINKMPDELKTFLQGLIEEINKLKGKSSEPEESEKFEETTLRGDLKGLDGRCNTFFTQMGGVLSKTMPMKHVERALGVFNKALENPMPYADIKRMMYQIKKYRNYDKQSLMDEVFNHLKIVEHANSRDLQASLAYEKKDIEEVLSFLIEEGKVIKHKNTYKITNEVEWEEDFMSVSKPLELKVPYFEEYARFSSGSMIILGAKSGAGKTHLSCNILKKIVDQNIKPHLLCTEAESKFGIISATLGMKVGDYKFKLVREPSTIELADNAVTIIDWLKAPESDYAKMESIYERLNEQLAKHKGLLIVLAQLKNETGKFYAEDMTFFYGSLVAKYFWSPIKDAKGQIYDWDSQNTYLKTEKIRDSKNGKQYLTIPTYFDPDKKTLELRKH